MSEFSKYLDALRSALVEVSPASLVDEIRRESKLLIIDLREEIEWQEGTIEGALRLPRSRLEIQIESKVPKRGTDIVLFCAGGTRSLLGAEALQRLGYTSVRSLAGGIDAWKSAGLPLGGSSTLSSSQRRRYARHLLLPEVGEAGQRMLLESKVLLIGAGGLGSPAAMYLACAGVGTLAIMDDDLVDESNLQRQVLHNHDRIGMAKVESARKTLSALNPELKVEIYRTRLKDDNAAVHLNGCDVVVDGTDNFATRYVLNDAALKEGIPVVHASVYRFDGQMTVFSGQGGPCYRCLYPNPPPQSMAPSCAEGGVLGVLPGVMGILQASETLKLLLGVGAPMHGRLLFFDALGTQFREIRIPPASNCPSCGA